MKIALRLKSTIRRVGNPQHLDKLCVVLAFITLAYELPATVITDLGASFGLYDFVQFYSYRVKFALIVVAVAGLNFVVNHRYVFKDWFFLLYMFFIAYMVTIVWINRDLYGAASPSDTEVTYALTFWWPILFRYVLFFIVGFYLPRLAKYIGYFKLIVIFSMGMILFYVDLGTMGLDTKNYVDVSFLGNYLFIGDATSIAALICIAFIKTNKTKIIFTVISGVTIFFIGSRTSFAVFSGSAFLYFIISLKPKLLVWSAIGIIAITVALQNIDYAELQTRNPRMFGVLVDYQADNSVQGREKLEQVGLEDIYNNIIFGKFGGQLDAGLTAYNSSWRAYIHSVFSYWRQFGILAMIIIVTFAIRFYTMLWTHRDLRVTPIFALYFLTGVFLCVEAAFSRSFGFAYTHLFFGLTVSLRYTMPVNNTSRNLARYYYQSIRRQPLFSEVSLPKKGKRKRRSGVKSMRF